MKERPASWRSCPGGEAKDRSAKMLEFLNKNKEWIFSGVGITTLTLIVIFGRKMLTWFISEAPRVRASVAITGTPLTGMIKLLAITVENHTKEILYIDNIFLEMDTGEQFMPMLDPLTGQGQAQRQVMPGNRFSFHIMASDIVKSGIPLDRFRCAAIRDAVNRVSRSSRRHLQTALKVICRAS
jgi:hypothetical protein